MRYLLFGDSEFYYAKGGAHDFLGAGDSIDDLAGSDCLKERGKCDDICWWHIFDTKTKEIVAGTKLQAHGANDINGGVDA